MKIFILGATGQTGSFVLNRALEQGHFVTAYTRSANKITLQHKNLKVIEGDMLSSSSLTLAMKDQDGVISCLGGDDNNQSTILTEMTKNIVKSMKNNDIKRLVNIATAGVHDEFSFITNLIVKMFYRNAIKDHRGAVEVILASDLNYTIARPLSLIDGPLTKTYRSTPKGVPKGGKNISREDLAYFLLDVFENQKHIKETVGLAY